MHELINVLQLKVLIMRRYVKFDTFHPAVEKGLPVTRVVSRVALQAILAEACIRVAGSDVISNDCHVVDYQEKVWRGQAQSLASVTEKFMVCAQYESAQQ
jgi:hypothetical protein